MPYEYGSCPLCNGELIFESLCPGYVEKGQWSHCYPACGNAFLYECKKIACGWWFIDGMNKKHTMYRENESRRPVWLAVSR